MNSQECKEDYKYKEIFEEFKKEYNKITNLGKFLGKGPNGEVKEVNYNGKALAGKIIEKKGNEEKQNKKIVRELSNEHIIKIEKIFYKKMGKDEYELILMEKAFLKDLGKLSNYCHKNNLLKLIYPTPFEEISSDCLIRFYAKQIISGLEILQRNNYAHLDLKLENILIFPRLILKISDFEYLKETTNNFKLYRGKNGCITPEYFGDSLVSSEIVKKQDYFALGKMLFELKYGISLGKFKIFGKEKMDKDRLNDVLLKNISFLDSQIQSTKEFIKFINNLINYNYEDRASFEEIYRNKWINTNTNEIDRTYLAFEDKEEKLILELQKKDFLLKKEKKFNQKKFHFKKKIK